MEDTGDVRNSQPIADNNVITLKPGNLTTQEFDSVLSYTIIEYRICY
jgi:hypothetical protein